MYDSLDQRHASESSGQAGGRSRFGDGNLVVVSNRQPYRHGETDDGTGIEVDRPTGGLTSGLDPAVQETGGTWIAWGDGEADATVVDAADRVSVPPEEPAYTLRRVWLTDEQVEGYYYGFSNRVLWPICHGALGTVEAVPGAWRQYDRTNRQFGAIAAEEADGQSTVWFHDYHLALAPRTVRTRLGPEPTLLHFWHVPWPDWDTFRACPHGRELLDGLLGNDVIGVHVPRFRHNFLECVEAGLDDATVDREGGTVHYRGSQTRIEAVPMGVPAERISRQAAARTIEDFREFASTYDVPASAALAVGVDRLDYTKGIPERLAALEHFWETHPEWRGSLTYVQNGSESRSQIPAYERIQDRVAARVERINRRFGTDDWQPVVYFTDNLPQEDLYGLYRYADVAIVSSIRDGLNLVALEYAAAQVDEDGALLLSDGTGSHDLLGEWAYSVSPFDPEGFAAQLAEALSAPGAERRTRMANIRQTVADADLDSWLERHAELARASATGRPRRVGRDAV